jgi:hypothetical protein
MGWTVLGAKPGGGRDFQHNSNGALRPAQPALQRVPGYSREYSIRGVALNIPPNLTSKLKEE